MIRLPQLLDASLQVAAPLRPVACRVIDNLTPLSMAYLTIGDMGALRLRDFVRIYTDDGESIYRVTNIRTDAGGVSDLTLQHGLCTLSDHIHPGESTKTGSLRTLLTELLSNQSRWTMGDVAVPDSEQVTWDYSNTNDLQDLLTIMKALPDYYIDCDQSVIPWRLHIRAKPTSVGCEARFDRNLSDVQIEYDCTELCTQVYAEGLSSPVKADTISIWGTISRYVSSVDVDRYLENHKNPRATITVTALGLSRLTGEPLDHFRKGMLCRCILPEMTVVQRIESLEQPDLLGAPEHVVLTLANTREDLSTTVAGLVSGGSYVSQVAEQAKQLAQQNQQDLKFEAETIEMLAQEISLTATKTEVDILSERIAVAEINMNEIFGQLEMKVTYTDFETELNEVAVLLDSLNAQLTLKASHSDLESTYNEVSLQLDAMNSTIAAKADLILLDGYVKASELESKVLTILEYGWANDLDVQSLVAGSVNTSYLSSDSITTDSLSTSSLSVGGNTLTRASKSFITSVRVLEDSDGIYGIATDSAVIYYYT